MIQDIAPHVLDNSMRFDEPRMADLVFVFKDPTDAEPFHAVLARVNWKGETVFPTVGDFKKVPELRFALRLDALNCYLTAPETSVQLPRGFEYMKMGRLHKAARKERVFAVATAYHLHEWYKDNVFCGRCAERLVVSKTERAMRCLSCGNVIYPKIQPAVIAAVTNGDKILMTRYAGPRGKQRALVAGFVEIGESAEECVAREVFEETGLRVKNVRHFKTQPWGVASDLLIGYFAELDGDDTVNIDAGELSAAQWVSRDDIYEVDDDFSLTNAMMVAFKEGRV